jgi:hypothetical protein
VVRKVLVRYEVRHEPNAPGLQSATLRRLRECGARNCTAAIILSTCFSVAQAPTNLSGTWVFTHADDRFQGTIVLRQAGSVITGTWLGWWEYSHTQPDHGKQTAGFSLTLSADGNRLDGFGYGWFINHANLNMRRAGTGVPSARTATPTIPHNSAHLSFPPPRGTWRWTIQSVVVGRGSTRKYVSYYYEAATDRSVEKPLTLPAGAEIVGIFPNNCMFSVRDELGHSFTFRNEEEAKA